MFHWIKKAYAEYKASTALDNAKNLHGVNLNEWNYLGRSKIKFVYSNSDAAEEAGVYLFCKVGDIHKRKYVIKPNDAGKYMCDKFQNHPWISELADLWIIGEKDLYEPVKDEPSKFLKEYMKEHHDSVWSTEELWWVNAVKSVSPPPKTNKKKTNKLSTDDNVVKVDFKKEEIVD